MNHIFEQTAEHFAENASGSDWTNLLPEAIRSRTGWAYACTPTDNGCHLEPVFRNMPYRNSFVPEIDIAVSGDDFGMIHMVGRPVKSVRVFMAVWFAVLLPMEVLFLTLAFTSRLDVLFPVFIPAGMCVFGYLLCKLATKITFDSVVQAIRKEIK